MVVVDVVVCGGGVILDVGVVVNFLVMVSGIVNAYELVLTAVDLAPYLVVQRRAVE